METVKSHVIGISKMVQHRGPWRYEDEFDRELLFHHRPVIVSMVLLGLRNVLT